MYLIVSHLNLTQFKNICEDGSVGVTDPGDYKVFRVKGNKLRDLPPTDKASEMMSSVFAES